LLSVAGSICWGIFFAFAATFFSNPFFTGAAFLLAAGDDSACLGVAGAALAGVLPLFFLADVGTAAGVSFSTVGLAGVLLLLFFVDLGAVVEAVEAAEPASGVLAGADAGLAGVLLLFLVDLGSATTAATLAGVFTAADAAFGVLAGTSADGVLAGVLLVFAFFAAGVTAASSCTWR
jgi:hypothetical protein